MVGLQNIAPDFYQYLLLWFFSCKYLLVITKGNITPTKYSKFLVFPGSRTRKIGLNITSSDFIHF